MSNLRFTGLLAVCTVLVACDESNRSTRDLTAPELGPAFSIADAGSLEKYAFRADQESPPAALEQLLADLAALGGPSVQQSSGPTECVATLVGTFDRVEVPPGAFCVLVNSIVRQWVHAQDDSRLIIANSQIGGNVKGLSAAAVQLFNSTVEGHVTIDDAGDLALASCFSAGSTIGGNFHCMNNNPAAPRIFVNTIGGELSVVRNVSPPNFIFDVVDNMVSGNTHVSNNAGANPKRVQRNVIAKQLVCQNNDPPFFGGPNVADKAHGQCF